MKRATLWVATAAVALSVAGVMRAELSESVPGPERQALIDLYNATHGEGWTRHADWGTSTDVCNWRGVNCAADEQGHNHVSMLWLSDNNLRGALPANLAEHLPRLEALMVGGNQLTGDVPEAWLKKWDDHAVTFEGWGNHFANVVRRASLKVESSGVLCSLDEDVRYSLELDDRTARFESLRCKKANPADRSTHCLVKKGTGPDLLRFSRALERLDYRSLSSEYDELGVVSTHGVYVVTTATLGNGKEWSLKTYNREGPVGAWAVQQFFLGLQAAVSWDEESFVPKCSWD